MRGLRLLQKHGVEYNILTTVNRVNGDHPLEVYRFLRDEVGTTWMQFIPIVERINADGHTLSRKGPGLRTVGAARAVRPFPDRRLRRVGAPRRGPVYVQTFDAALRNWLGMSTSGMCVFNETCGTALALEHNGDLYSCDHFVEPNYMLGNIQRRT